MLLTDINCVFSNETINGSCAFANTNTFNIQVFDVKETLFDIRIHFHLISHLDNGTYVDLVEKKFNFCTFTKKISMYPVVNMIYHYIKLGAQKIPDSCPIEKVKQIYGFSNV